MLTDGRTDRQTDRRTDRQTDAEDGMAGLQRKFQNLNAKVNQMLTDRRTSPNPKPELLCNPAKKPLVEVRLAELPFLYFL